LVDAVVKEGPVFSIGSPLTYREHPGKRREKKCNVLHGM